MPESMIIETYFSAAPPVAKALKTTVGWFRALIGVSSGELPE